MDQDPSLPSEHVAIAARAANEGVPIAAIARIVQQPYDLVVDVLQHAAELGHIGEIPRADWPPGTKFAERRPSVQRSSDHEDMEFACRKHFSLTGLEAGFMIVLLRYDCADKERLHGVIEQQRQMRATRPNDLEMTDPKMVDVIICKLRKKLKKIDPEAVLLTSWGRGYYFEPDIKKRIFDRVGGQLAAVVSPLPVVLDDEANLKTIAA